MPLSQAMYDVNVTHNDENGNSLCSSHQQILLHFLSFLAHMGIIKCFLSHYCYCPLRHAFWCPSSSSSPRMSGETWICFLCAYRQTWVVGSYQRLTEFFLSVAALKHHSGLLWWPRHSSRNAFNWSPKWCRLCTGGAMRGFTLAIGSFPLPASSCFPLDHFGNHFDYLNASQHTNKHRPFLTSQSPLWSWIWREYPAFQISQWLLAVSFPHL